MQVFFSVAVLGSTTYKLKRFEADSLEVISPKRLTILSKDDNLLYEVELLDIKFSVHESCSTNILNACHYIEQSFKKAQIVHVQVEPNGKEGFQGYVYLDGISLSDLLIQEGFYRFDHMQSRARHLSLLEKEAFCKMKGIWANNQNSLKTLYYCQR